MMMKQLRKLTVNDVPVFNFFEDIDNRRKKNIVVNPDVVYGGRDSENLKALRVLFVSQKKGKTKRKSK